MPAELPRTCSDPELAPESIARVLVLEDDQVLREILIELLSEEGFDAAGYHSYTAVRQAVRQGARLLVADFWGSSHVSLEPNEREQIKEVAAELPTILLTARAWAEDIRADDLGLLCILSKPPVIDELLLQVRLGVSSAQDN